MKTGLKDTLVTCVPLSKRSLKNTWTAAIQSADLLGSDVLTAGIARVTSHIPDKGQVMVRYSGLYTNAHRGKMRKAQLSIAAEEPSEYM